ncbi:hypothetical protein CP8484711_0371B, partial [Chlamydia psittaci 84-8471/1]
SC